jgi:hypothetical protein
MNEKLFRPTNVIIDHKPLRAFEIKCGKCGTTQTERMNTFKGAKSGASDQREFQAVALKFHRAGWQVGLIPSQHRCFVCRPPAKPLSNADLRQTAAVINLPTQAHMGREQMPTQQSTANGANAVLNLGPKLADRDTKRLIIITLQECYDEKNGCYCAGHTDKVVAQRLNCPQAWVADIRDEIFGDAGSNPELDGALTEAKDLAAEVQREVDKMRKQIAQQTNEIKEWLNKMNVTLDRIDPESWAGDLYLKIDTLLSRTQDNEKRLIDIQRVVRPGS